jgi:hypothetical protein
MARGHARLLLIEVGLMPAKAVCAFNVDHRERMPKRGGIARALKQPFGVCRGILVGGEAFGAVGG